jgi:hypothetical protein
MSGKDIDLTGQRFGKLVVIERTIKPDNKKKKSSWWLCQCDCKNVVVFDGFSLSSGHTKSCGCSRLGKGVVDITGQKFGKLTAVETVRRLNEKSGKYQLLWRCKCDCGNETIVDGYQVRNGHTSSCGLCYSNLVGQKFGSLTVMRETDKQENSSYKRWLCQCDCGNEKIVSSVALRSGNTVTCGDRTKHYENLIGMRFGRLIVIEKVNKPENVKGTAHYWRCKCDCSGETITCTASLNRGHTTSCGCKQREETSLAHFRDGNILHFPTYWYFMKDNEKVKCRSSYEVIFANYLLKNDIEFKYEPETFILDMEKGKRVYTPDFLIIKENKYVELKGAFLNDQLERIEFFKKDHDISILYWEDMVKYCDLPFISRYTYNKHSKKLGLEIQDYLAEGLYLN